jgi:hypothetical protein
METGNEKKKRFRLVKLEERVVPVHLPAVAIVQVPQAPGIDVAQVHAHKVRFIAAPPGTCPAADPLCGCDTI